ncbi:helix-turn-helix domain-containing protein [Streptomyces sp. NPDC052016]|uniref:helix-turn-helix domain-containing protein n=1 Tax=Streptomyces sp. NPDC052016 TaxID=3365680 RepID=UPI0037D6979E
MSAAIVPTTDQLLYTPEEAARVLRFGRSTVYELMAEGSLTYIKRGRSRRIRRSDLEAYVNSLEPAAA